MQLREAFRSLQKGEILGYENQLQFRANWTENDGPFYFAIDCYGIFMLFFVFRWYYQV